MTLTTTTYDYVEQTPEAVGKSCNNTNTPNGCGIHILSGSASINTWVRKVKFKLKTSGSPTGNFQIVIKNSGGTTVATTGDIAVSTLTTSYVTYEYTLDVARKIAADDKILMFYADGSGINYIIHAIITATTPSGYKDWYDADDTVFTPSITFDSSPGSPSTKTFTVDLIAQNSGTTQSMTFTLDLLSQLNNQTKTFTLDLIAENQHNKTFTLDLIAKATKTKTFTLDLIAENLFTKTFTINLIAKKASTKTFTVDLIAKSLVNLKEWTLDLLASKTKTKTFTIDMLVGSGAGIIKTFTLDLVSKSLGNTKEFTLDLITKLRAQTKTFTVDLLAQIRNNTKTFTLDLIANKKGNTKTFTLDLVAIPIVDNIFDNLHTRSNVRDALHTK